MNLSIVQGYYRNNLPNSLVRFIKYTDDGNSLQAGLHIDGKSTTYIERAYMV